MNYDIEKEEQERLIDIFTNELPVLRARLRISQAELSRGIGISRQTYSLVETKILVISKYALDYKPYNTSYSNVTWETCSLRTWLNDTFYNAAFSTTEKTKIVKTTVSADKNPSYSTIPGNATSDNVFLLSITEVNKYFDSGEARMCILASDNILCNWWLRSPGSYQNHAAYVSDLGSVYDRGEFVSYANIYAVRPAMWIDLSK